MLYCIFLIRLLCRLLRKDKDIEFYDAANFGANYSPVCARFSQKTSYIREINIPYFNTLLT